MNPVQRDYFQASKTFDFDGMVSNAICGTFTAMNACYECCDRHADADAVALIQENADGSSSRHSYAELRDQSAQFANYLTQQGIQAGDVVAGLLPRGHALLVTILGAWRIGAVYQPLFTAFGPKAIEHRLQAPGAKLVVSDAENRSKLLEVAGCPAVLTVTDAGAGLEEGDGDFWPILAPLSVDFEPVMRSADDPFLLMFTSGTTGLAKPLEVPLRAIVAFQRYMIDAVGLRAEDSFWNVADPGWAYGLYFGITGPMSMGLPVLSVAGAFNLDRCLEIAKKYNVSNLAGAPTVFRMLIAAGEKVADQWKGQLRVVSSAGEPLNPEVIRWFKQHLNVAINDHYGQTEMGMVLCNHHNLAHPMHIGAAGYASPGHRVVVVDEQSLEELPAGVPGILSVDIEQSPMFWFNGYKDMPTTSFKGRYYLTGDTAELNSDGSISFVGRSDDVISTSGYRVGPFDVESALLEHPAVIEAAVVGKPDVQRNEIIKAFVILQEGYAGTPELAEELRLHVRNRLAAHAYPREIEFPAELPKTPSGKVQRFILRINEINKYNEQQHAKQAAS
ncbi:MAG TPA: AMP-binding protein [Gammaproteobacteria bacterium]|nr:AMP-binding protein [Gammaproteobacteria bacterium]